jgi:hypothetical protein
MTTRVFLPDNIARWLTQQLPLAGLDEIQFRLCRRIPFSWLVGNRTLAGITFWNRIYLIEGNWRLEPASRSSLELVLHELVHVLQYRKHPFWFPFQYVIDHVRYGYDDNPAEIEAREVASKVADSFFSTSKKQIK